jgi:hypothetical protein
MLWNMVRIFVTLFFCGFAVALNSELHTQLKTHPTAPHSRHVHLLHLERGGHGGGSGRLRRLLDNAALPLPQ